MTAKGAKKMNAQNPYETAYELKHTLDDIETQIKSLEEQKKQLTAEFERLILTANDAPVIDGYRLIKRRKTRENRIVIPERIAELRPELLFRAGRFTFESVEIPESEQQKYITENISNYSIKLQELDAITGGKKESVPYVDLDIKESVEYNIEKI